MIFPRGPGIQSQIWREIQIFLTSSQNPTIWVSLDSPGPQQPMFNIFELIGPSEGPGAPFQTWQEIQTFEGLQVFGLPLHINKAFAFKLLLEGR